MKNKNLVVNKPKSAIVASEKFRYQKSNSYLILYLDKNKKLIFQKQFLEKDVYKPIFTLPKPKEKIFFIVILYNKLQLKLKQHSINKLIATSILLGIRLLDIIFISKNEYHSLHESGEIT